MTNVIHLSKGSDSLSTSCSNPHLLDTLAQPSTIGRNSQTYSQIDKDKTNLQKRAKAKAYTNSYILDLIDLPNNKLTKSYWSTWHCSKVVLQEDKKLTSKYCNQRWCLVCNRIRTAKMINGYENVLNKFEAPRFTTLTFPNVKAKDLKKSIKEMSHNISKIVKNVKKTYGIKVKALRKYECTYNAKTNTYNPHYHLIIEGGHKVSNLLISLWLKQYPTAVRKAQDISMVNEETIRELCKYFTKVISKDNDYNPKALDIMFRAVKGLRTFQPIGIKKYVSEDVDELQAVEVEFIEPQTEIYSFEEGAYDWVSGSGVLLSEYTPTADDMKVINQEYIKTKLDINISLDS